MALHSIIDLHRSRGQTTAQGLGCHSVVRQAPTHGQVLGLHLRQHKKKEDDTRGLSPTLREMSLEATERASTTDNFKYNAMEGMLLPLPRALEPYLSLWLEAQLSGMGATWGGRTSMNDRSVLWEALRFLRLWLLRRPLWL